MGVFSVFKSKKKDTDGLDQASKASEIRFLLHANALGWQSMLQNADGTLVDKPQFGEAKSFGKKEQSSWEKAEKVIKDAVGENKKLLRRASKITILIDGIGVRFTDNKSQALIAASGSKALQYGQQLLNSDDVTFGVVDLPMVPGVEKQHTDSVYAFVGSQRIREYLSLFDKEGTKITEAIPKEYLLIHRATQQSDMVYGALHMGATKTQLVLVNRELGIVLVRSMPVGLLTIVEAMAEKMMMQEKDVLKKLTEKDLIAEIIPDSQEEGGDANAMAQSSLHQQALQPLLSQFLDDLKESLAFFAFQKVAGSPTHLEVFGTMERVTGLSEWLKQYMGIPIVLSDKSMLELLSEISSPVNCNLLKGAESSLLSVGRLKYFYDGRRFVTPDELAKTQPQNEGSDESVPPSNPHERAGSGSRRKRGGRPRKPSQRGGRGGKGGGKSFFSFLGKGQSSGSEPTSSQAIAEDQKSKSDQFKALFLLMVVGVLYLAYTEYEVVKKKYDTQARKYLKARKTQDGLMKQLNSLGTRAVSQRKVEDLNKIFWSEKFLALAKNMNEHIWLTDIYLSEATREVGGVQVKSKTMMIDGRVLPSSDGHVQIIAEYIDRLLQDKEWFMSDFRNVVFNGSEMDGSFEDPESDPQIRFTLQAWYDKNKRIESKTKGSSNESGGSGGLNDMHNNINRHNQALEDVLGGGVK